MLQASNSPVGASSTSDVCNAALESSVCISEPSSPADGTRNGKHESAFKNDRPALAAVGEVPHSAVRCSVHFGRWLVAATAMQLPPFDSDDDASRVTPDVLQ